MSIDVNKPNTLPLRRDATFGPLLTKGASTRSPTSSSGGHGSFDGAMSQGHSSQSRGEAPSHALPAGPASANLATDGGSQADRLRAEYDAWIGKNAFPPLQGGAPSRALPAGPASANPAMDGRSQADRLKAEYDAWLKENVAPSLPGRSVDANAILKQHPDLDKAIAPLKATIEELQQRISRLDGPPSREWQLETGILQQKYQQLMPGVIQKVDQYIPSDQRSGFMVAAGLGPYVPLANLPVQGGPTAQTHAPAPTPGVGVSPSIPPSSGRDRFTRSGFDPQRVPTIGSGWPAPGSRLQPLRATLDRVASTPQPPAADATRAGSAQQEVMKLQTAYMQRELEVMQASQKVKQLEHQMRTAPSGLAPCDSGFRLEYEQALSALRTAEEKLHHTNAAVLEAQVKLSLEGSLGTPGAS